MPQVTLPGPVGPEPSRLVRAIRAVGDAVTSLRSRPPETGDLFEQLSLAEEEVFRRHWPEGSPSGEADPYYNRAMEIRMRRLHWRARVETGGDLAWLLAKIGGVVLVFAIAWQTAIV